MCVAFCPVHLQVCPKEPSPLSPPLSSPLSPSLSPADDQIGSIDPNHYGSPGIPIAVFSLARAFRLPPQMGSTTMRLQYVASLGFPCMNFFFFSSCMYFSPTPTNGANHCVAPLWSQPPICLTTMCTICVAPLGFRPFFAMIKELLLLLLPL